MKLFLRAKQQRLGLLWRLDLFQDQLIYHHNFFESKALKLIIGKSKTNRTAEILPEHFNDDKLGRVLDEIYDLGPDMLF